MSASVRTSDHQFIDRASGKIVSETFLCDRHVRWLYSSVRESAPRVFAWVTNSTRLNDMLAKLNFDKPFSVDANHLARVLQNAHIDFSELAIALPAQPSWREVFGRKIRYWELRPMPEQRSAVVSPCDGRLLLGTFQEHPRLAIKEKFFELGDLLDERGDWVSKFASGAWALFRLTPEQYHFTHCPVSGLVEDVYEAGAAYHSCNPTASIEAITPLSKNRRLITIVNTDCLGGSWVGRVAIIEIVALLIGKIRQAYSEEKYTAARSLEAGMMLKKGAVKSEFMPGSSSVVLLFEPNKIEFENEFYANQNRSDVVSRFSTAFRCSMVETQVRVRSQIAVTKLNLGN